MKSRLAELKAENIKNVFYLENKSIKVIEVQVLENISNNMASRINRMVLVNANTGKVTEFGDSSAANEAFKQNIVMTYNDYLKNFPKEKKSPPQPSDRRHSIRRTTPENYFYFEERDGKALLMQLSDQAFTAMLDNPITNKQANRLRKRFLVEKISGEYPQLEMQGIKASYANKQLITYGTYSTKSCRKKAKANSEMCNRRRSQLDVRFFSQPYNSVNFIEEAKQDLVGMNIVMPKAASGAM